MGRSHGKHGSVTCAGITGSTLLNCHAWSMNRTLETADGTTFGAVNRVYDDGIADADGTFSCYVDDTTAITDLMAAANTPITATAIFTTNSGKTFTVKILITSYAISVGLDSNQVATFNWKLGGTGVAGDFVSA